MSYFLQTLYLVPSTQLCGRRGRERERESWCVWDANKNATLLAIVGKINKSFRLPGHIWNFIHVLWLSLSFCCLFRNILIRFSSSFSLYVFTTSPSCQLFHVAPCLLLSEYFSHFYKFASATTTMLAQLLFSPLFTSLPFSSPLWLHIYSACSIARISLDLGNSLLFGHSLHALRESVIERHFERGVGGGKGSEHLLHVTLLPACNIVACNSLLLLLPLLLTMLFVWLGLQMLQRATIK